MSTENKLTVKVCGMKYTDNRRALEILPIDIFGFIFYPPSPRFVNPADLYNLRNLTGTQKKKAGVFVDSTADHIMEIIQLAGLSHIQLHGCETPGFCDQIRKTRVSVIKTFRVDDQFDFSTTEPYIEAVDYFLFDTRADKAGGTGKKFNWPVLEKYDLNVPFFLSGGIDPSDAKSIKILNHPMLIGIDLNSGFEDVPGVKNFEKLNNFLDMILNFKP